ncbi:50S ribosomal protein L24 [Candidatus Altiarchaeota archaeon]
MKKPESSKPRKQRKWLHNAPLHERRLMMSSALSQELKEKYHRQSIPIRKGDTVTVMRGQFKGVTGVITRIDRGKYRVYMEGVTSKKADGTDVERSIHTSNLKITDLNLDDKKRREALGRKVTEAK